MVAELQRKIRAKVLPFIGAVGTRPLFPNWFMFSTEENKFSLLKVMLL